jgi:HSP20 family protein
MKMLSPPNELFGFRKEMDRLFDRLWRSDTLTEFPAMGDWIPMMDLWESREFFTVKLEVPGIDPKDIHITLQEQLLTIKGEKKVEYYEEKDEWFYRKERTYGTFARIVRLPVLVEPKRVNATFKNGVLTVQLFKVPVANSGTIPITTEK